MQAGAPITPRLAEEAIYSRLTCLPIESLPLTQCVGATLRENIYAERDHPPFDRVIRDGIAVDSEALLRGHRRFRIQGTQAAGVPAIRRKSIDDAIEVGGRSDAARRLRHRGTGGAVRESSMARHCSGPTSPAPPYCNVHRRASDSRQGRLLLESGTLLRAPEIAVAASAGMARVRVSSQPAIMVVSTGDELVEPGDPSRTSRCAAPMLTQSPRRFAGADLAASATITCATTKTACASGLNCTSRPMRCCV